MPISSVGSWASRFRRLLPGSAFAGLQTPQRVLQGQLSASPTYALPYADLYAMLRYYYANNGLYQRLQEANYGADRVSPALQGLRNPVYRIVEFYPATLWPGDLPAALPLDFPDSTPSARQDALTAAIQQTWTWSNWAPGKQVFARWLAMLGDMFLKVCQPTDSGRVYFELIDPAHVVDFDADSRGYLTYCRIDIPREERRPDGLLDRYTHVEVWDKATQELRIYRLMAQTATVTGLATSTLGPPEEIISFSSFGIDFIPICHCKCLDVGELRGVSAFMLQLDKIDNLNRDATRLAQLLYRHNRKTTIISANDRDAGGRPGGLVLPLPDVNVTEDEEVWSLPGAAAVSTLMPNIDWSAHRDWINDAIRDLQGDCPELAYWFFTEDAATSDLSGRAIRYLLGPAINKLLEVRGRAEDTLARADAMALTLGQAAGLPGFSPAEIGTYADGTFEHTFEAREVVSLSDKEVADTALVEWQAAAIQAGLGVSQQQILRERGYTDAQITQMDGERATHDIIPPVAQ